VTDAGVPVAAGPNEAREILKQWFQATVAEAPDATPNGTLSIMLKIWGDATHISFK
jgi:hypothetical protein